MKYKLVNLSSGNLQINLYSPKKINHNCETLNRPGPVVALSLKKGNAVDILPYFDYSLEKAHESVCYSRDVLRLFGPATLAIFICDDDNKPVDPKAIFGTLSEDEMTEEELEKMRVEKELEQVGADDRLRAEMALEAERKRAAEKEEAEAKAALESEEDAKSAKKKAAKKKSKK